MICYVAFAANNSNYMPFPKRPSIQSFSEDYGSRLVKYIPTESVLLYQTARGIISGGQSDDQSFPIDLICQGGQEKFLFELVFWTVLILTPIYTFVATRNNDSKNPVFHSIAAMVSFAIWVMTFGDIFNCYFKNMDWYTPVFMSIILLLVTAIIPLIEVFIRPNKQPHK